MDAVETIRYMQLEKIIGELRAYKVTYYNSSPGNEEYYRVTKIIDEMIEDLKNNFG
jgi:hypothetical protein